MRGTLEVREEHWGYVRGTLGYVIRGTLGYVRSIGGTGVDPLTV